MIYKLHEIKKMIVKRNGRPFKPSALPAILTFKRISTRMFPDGVEVAQYRCDQTGEIIVYPSQYSGKDSK